MKLFFLKFAKYSVLTLAIVSLLFTLAAFFSDVKSLPAGIFCGGVTFFLCKFFIKLKESVMHEEAMKSLLKKEEYTRRFSELYGPGKEKEVQDWINQNVPSNEHEMAAQVLQSVEKKYKEKEEKERKALEEEKEREALLEKYLAEYGDEIVESYQKREIMFGMPQQMIQDIFGEPADIKKERTEKTLLETYFYAKDGVKYEDSKTSTFKIKVEFKNGIVKGYKEY